jgi:hypothetical protein
MRRLLLPAAASATLALAAGIAAANSPSDPLGPPTHEPSAIAPGSGEQANDIRDGFSLSQLVHGPDSLENSPTGSAQRYGWLGDPQASANTEPDENTYLDLGSNPGGPNAGYDYGTHFLFQGHENAGDQAYLTRINLDVQDPAHRITLLRYADQSTGKTGFNRIDGSTWDPFTRTMLYAQEDASAGGVIEQSPFWSGTTPPATRTLYGSIGRGGFEGIHPDSEGNLLLIEDVGGTADSTTKVRPPNSFVYRFVPYRPRDLSAGGKLQVLQVKIDGDAVTYPESTADQTALHNGDSYAVKWVTIHDTADSTAVFNANSAAKSGGGTPFKRPENAAWQPGTDFHTFYFDPTGDTDQTAGNAAADQGAWGSIFRVDLADDRDTGTIRRFVLGDADHSSFDNLAFASDGRTLLAAEDRGDTLHDQLSKLDSIWQYDTANARYGPDDPARAYRFLALGRDSVAAPAGEEDNEPTGLFVSDGRPTVGGLLGTRSAGADARWFFTEQHGDNRTYEIVPQP